MSRNKKPRRTYRARPVTAHTVALAMHYAAKPAQANRAQVLGTLAQCIRALRVVAVSGTWRPLPVLLVCKTAWSLCRSRQAKAHNSPARMPVSSAANMHTATASLTLRTGWPAPRQPNCLSMRRTCGPAMSTSR